MPSLATSRPFEGPISVPYVPGPVNARQPDRLSFGRHPGAPFFGPSRPLEGARVYKYGQDSAVGSDTAKVVLHYPDIPAGVPPFLPGLDPGTPFVATNRPFEGARVYKYGTDSAVGSATAVVVLHYPDVQFGHIPFQPWPDPGTPFVATNRPSEGDRVYKYGKDSAGTLDGSSVVITLAFPDTQYGHLPFQPWPDPGYPFLATARAFEGARVYKYSVDSAVGSETSSLHAGYTSTDP